MALSTIHLKENMTIDELVSALNTNFSLIENINTTQIFKDKSGTRRILIGQDANDELRVKVSAPGKDVTTASGRDLYFDSSNKTYQIVDKKTLSMSVSYVSGSTYYNQVRVPHGLDYTPSYEAYVTLPSAITYDLPSVNLHNPALVYGTSSGKIFIGAIASVTVDESDIILTVQFDNFTAPTGTYTVSADVILKREPQF